MNNSITWFFDGQLRIETNYMFMGDKTILTWMSYFSYLYYNKYPFRLLILSCLVPSVSVRDPLEPPPWPLSQLVPETITDPGLLARRGLAEDLLSALWLLWPELPNQKKNIQIIKVRKIYLKYF